MRFRGSSARVRRTLTKKRLHDAVTFNPSFEDFTDNAAGTISLGFMILHDELGIDGRIERGILNSGDIEAAGGRVLLTASRNVFAQAINTDGSEPWP